MVSNAQQDSFEPSNFDLVVNSTSAGLKDEYLPCPKELLEPVLKTHLLLLIVYMGKSRHFLALAKQNGCEIKDSEDMLLFQGVLALNTLQIQKPMKV